ncbi:primosomal replication protein [Thalassomonas viridans]|uniref:Primosomal replication protein n=1 Tax=Thalassomonas viridans TaxID=137584 RepID=A0AAE9Z5K9_9GAMM|nr:primosomal replication protein PriC [Thalassomonas viridans]WDE07023.1 primosomal replication protein [Thalassomonas viridans]
MKASINQNAINRLSAIISALTEQAKATDKHNSGLKSHRLIEDNALFSNALFLSQSDKFLPYALEIGRRISELQRLMQSGNKMLVQALLESIEQQLQALINALGANEALHQNANVRLNTRTKRRQQQQYRQAAQKVLQPSHQLHQKLAEHHEFERRLLAMITDRERLRESSRNQSQNNQKLAAEILALHQRLGRCRQAISVIERDIEFAEKRQ